MLTLAATSTFGTAHIALTGAISGVLAAGFSRRYGQSRAIATVIAFAVNVLTI